MSLSPVRLRSCLRVRMTLREGKVYTVHRTL